LLIGERPAERVKIEGGSGGPLRIVAHLPGD